MRNFKFINCLPLLFIMLLVTSCASSEYSKIIKSRPENKTLEVSQKQTSHDKKIAKNPFVNPPRYWVKGKEYRVLRTNRGYEKVGMASWYGPGFNHHKTSTGEIYNMYAMTAAHKTLALPSHVKVTNLQNHRSINVKVNDRGPFVKNRIIDLSYAAAKKLGMLAKGTALVKVETIGATNNTPSHSNNTAEQHAYLQLAAFQQRKNAERFIARFQKKVSESLTIKKANHVKKQFYRVLAGPFNDGDNIGNVRHEIISLGISKSPAIVQL